MRGAKCGVQRRIARYALHPGYTRSHIRDSINSDHIKFKAGIIRWYRRS
jgi:hypothetical protein